MSTRRQFLGALAAPPLAALTPVAFHSPGVLGALEAFAAAGATPAAELARDEAVWFSVQKSFTVDRSVVNLNNGGVSPAPAHVQAAMKRFLDYSNETPAYSMWRVLEPRKEQVRARLARTFGCDAEELALTRNASESLQICQFGFDLQRGDEVLTTDQDYPRMRTTFEQRERREGLALKTFKLPVPAEDPAEVVRRFEEQITDRTKLILMCHVINLTGQILPVREVVAMARARGIPVIVDGAHAFAHMEFDVTDLDCDYYATSLHKWLLAPHGTGFLYVRRDRIADLWPLMAAPEKLDDDVRKFEEIGTHPVANTLAISEALSFHLGIGAARKEARLRYLRDFWARRLLEHDAIRLHTSLDPRFSCAIATVQIDGVPTADLQQYLWRDHRILTVAIQHDDFEGLRVTPNVYTTLEELERFCEAMERVLRDGLPA